MPIENKFDVGFLVSPEKKTKYENQQKQNIKYVHYNPVNSSSEGEG